MDIGLALSGGGIRAMVFHLGVMARMAEEELLERVSMISSVSGGSLIIAQVLAANHFKWPDSDIYLKEIVPFIRQELTNRSLSMAIRRNLITNIWLMKYGRARLLAESLKQNWKLTQTFADLHDLPRWIINATTYETGKNWRFTTKRSGDYIFNYTANQNMSIAEAVSASAAFPGLLGPLTYYTKKQEWFRFSGKGIVPCKPTHKKIHLWDGGVYDNLGTEALFKPGKGLRDGINFIVVSDAGSELGIKEPTWVFNRFLRMVYIMMDQVRSVRARIINDYFNRGITKGTYVKLGLSASRILKHLEYNQKTIDTMVQNVLAEEEVKYVFRYGTNLNKITESDFELLFRHGWEATNYSLHGRDKMKFGNLQYSIT